MSWGVCFFLLSANLVVVEQVSIKNAITQTLRHWLCMCSRLVWRGWRKSLTYDDLYDLNDEDKTKVVSARFSQEWNKELKKSKFVCVFGVRLYVNKHRSTEFMCLYVHVCIILLSIIIPQSSCFKAFLDFLFIPFLSFLLYHRTSFINQHQTGVDPEVAVRGRCRQCQGPSLVLAMFRTFLSTFLVGGIFKLLQDILQFTTPLILK